MGLGLGTQFDVNWIYLLYLFLWQEKDESYNHFAEQKLQIKFIFWANNGASDKILWNSQLSHLFYTLLIYTYYWFSLVLACETPKAKPTPNFQEKTTPENFKIT